jgi:hypothetical protein
MTDTATRAPWLEAHSEFEGVGAHELNGRYEHVDGDPASWDTALRASAEATLAVTPALRRAQGLLSAAMLTTAPHRPCTVYSGAFVAGGTIWTDPRIREGEYGRRPTALAAYTTEAKARALPGVAQHPWSSWQFSSNGPVPGVTGRCDMNRCDDTAIFDLAAGITHSTVTEATTATVQEDTVMYISNSETRTATSSDPGHAWFELMPGGRLRIVTDINDVKVALGTDVPETVTSVQRKNSWIDGLLAKGAWTEPVAAPAAPVLSGRIELTGTLS